MAVDPRRGSRSPWPSTAGPRYVPPLSASKGEQDVEIVRRIRELCPDGRYEGSSDEELIELFRRNKRVLASSDEDVIAAMTRSRWGDGAGLARRLWCRRRASLARGSL